jgi:hypothetical protein
MNFPDPSERRERVKQVLADSYPRLAEGQRKEALPASVRAALAGSAAPAARREAAGESLLDKLLSFFRGPQLAALGVAAVLAIVAVVMTRPPVESPGDGKQTMRSGGGGAGLPSRVVLHGLSEEQAEALKSSGYFRPEQLLVVPAGQDLAAFLETQRRPNLVLVDGIKGTLSAPFATAEGPAAITFESGESDLAPRILDLLAEIPSPEDEP